MFSTCVLWRENMNGWARRLFRIEQLESSSVLRSLPASRCHKVIQKLYKNLSKEDMASLTIRATLYEQRVRAGHPHPLDNGAVRVAGRQGQGMDTTPLLTPSTPSPKMQSESTVNPFEFFLKEQSSNPALKGFAAAERQSRLKAIYETLPENAREALEQRARLHARTMAAKAAVTASSQLKPTTLATVGRRKDKKRDTRATGRRQPTGVPAKRKAKGKLRTSTSTSTVKRRARQGGHVPSAYAVFVKEQMPSVMDRPPKERLKEISRRWKARETGRRGVPMGTASPSSELSSQSTATPAGMSAALPVSARHDTVTPPPPPTSSSGSVSPSP